MLGISNLPSNLCRPTVPWLALSSRLSSLLHLTLPPSSCAWHPSTSVAPLSYLSPSSSTNFALPVFPLLPLHPSPLNLLRSQMLGGQDWPFAGPSLRHHGGGASARCLVAYSYRLYESDESRQPLTRRRKRRIQVNDWRNFSCMIYFCLWRALLELSCLFLSPTPPPPPPPASWVIFGSCWAGCDWRAKLQADVNLVRVAGTEGKQWRTSNEKARLHIQAGCCWRWTWIRVRARGRSVFRGLGLWPIRLQAMSKGPKNKNVSWVSTAVSVADQQGEGGVRMDGRGGLFVDYQSSVWVLFHLCQRYLLLNWLSLVVISENQRFRYIFSHLSSQQSGAALTQSTVALLWTKEEAFFEGF